jgi:hypothetical protein
VKEKQIMSYKELKLMLIFKLWLKRKNNSFQEANSMFLPIKRKLVSALKKGLFLEMNLLMVKLMLFQFAIQKLLSMIVNLELME